MLLIATSKFKIFELMNRNKPGLLKHPQRLDFLNSNTCFYSRLYGTCFIDSAIRCCACLGGNCTNGGLDGCSCCCNCDVVDVVDDGNHGVCADGKLCDWCTNTDQNFLDVIKSEDGDSLTHMTMNGKILF